ncbi:hypothetical protein DV36_03780 [Amycolatopsis mediterranei]|nr:hypothetical protein DV36_03780 [Amycolatopsis mediterranei]
MKPASRVDGRTFAGHPFSCQRAAFTGQCDSVGVSNTSCDAKNSSARETQWSRVLSRSRPARSTSRPARMWARVRRCSRGTSNARAWAAGPASQRAVMPRTIVAG